MAGDVPRPGLSQRLVYVTTWTWQASRGLWSQGKRGWSPGAHMGGRARQGVDAETSPHARKASAVTAQVSLPCAQRSAALQCHLALPAVAAVLPDGSACAWVLVCACVCLRVLQLLTFLHVALARCHEKVSVLSFIVRPNVQFPLPRVTAQKFILALNS